MRGTRVAPLSPYVPYGNPNDDLYYSAPICVQEHVRVLQGSCIFLPRFLVLGNCRARALGRAGAGAAGSSAPARLGQRQRETNENERSATPFSSKNPSSHTEKVLEFCWLFSFLNLVMCRRKLGQC